MIMVLKLCLLGGDYLFLESELKLSFAFMTFFLRDQPSWFAHY